MKRNLKFPVAIMLVLIISLSSANIQGYPILFKCDENEKLLDIQLSEQFQNVLELFASASGDERDAMRTNICKGNLECLKQLNQIIVLVDANKDIVKKLFDKSVAELKEGFVKLDKELYELNKKIPDLKSLLACTNARATLSSEEFLTKNGEVKIFYPNYSNYMYITGCLGVNKNDCSLGKKSQFETTIRNSILLGVDPYAVLALALMEGRLNAVDGLYLDPIGEIDMLGCSGKQVNNLAPDAFKSFNTSFILKPSVNENKEINDTLKRYLEIKSGKTYRNGESFLCRNLTKSNESVEKLEERSVDGNQCCLKLNFELVNENDRLEIGKALPYLHVKKILNKGFQKKSDPAFSLQVFNGFTDLMGGAESVSNFRSGLNFYNDPTYGYQSMDYILNSFMSNPFIKQTIEKFNRQYGDNYKSVICQKRGGGYFMIDSNYYFDKHKNAKRFDGIYTKYKQGKNYSDLSFREKMVFRRELEDKSVYPKLNSMDNHMDFGFKEMIETKLQKLNPPLNLNRQLFEGKKIVSFQEYLEFCTSGNKLQYEDDRKLIQKSYEIEKEYNEAHILGANDKIDQLSAQVISTRRELRLAGYRAPKSILLETLSPEEVMKKFKLSKIVSIDELKRLYRYYVKNNEDPFLVDQNQAMQEYFEKVYDQRSTVGKASSYPFTPFSDEQILSLKKSLVESDKKQKKN